MPRNRGTSCKGKQKKHDRASGMGRALQRFHPTSNYSSQSLGMDTNGAQTLVLDDSCTKTRVSPILEMDDVTELCHQAELNNREFECEREQFVVMNSILREWRPNQDTKGYCDDKEKEEEPNIRNLDKDWQHQLGPELSRDSFRYLHLTVPRRPPWDETTTADELDRMEKEKFMEWRRAISEKEEEVMTHPSAVAVTPFEKNIEVWRQLWRVLEQSQVIVQIVDARNPMFYVSHDLRCYTEEELGKPMLILVNKSDFLTERQRAVWYCYFQRHGIAHLFFSAHVEQAKLDESEKLKSTRRNLHVNDRRDMISLDGNNDDTSQPATPPDNSSPRSDVTILDSDVGVTHPLTRNQLLLALQRFALDRNIQPSKRYGHRTQFGMVGFPNVGKSSVINVLVNSSAYSHDGARVGVTSKPGKTKHFQTLRVPDRADVMLCDCPGLMFPSLVSNTADLIAAGVYPIAHMKDPGPVVELICRRISREVLEAFYSIHLGRPSIWDLQAERTTTMTSKIKSRSSRIISHTAEELLDAYCLARSLLCTGSGVPDYQRASRVIVRDYVEGRLLYCHPPPLCSVSTSEWNQKMNDFFNKETLVTAITNTHKLLQKLGGDAMTIQAGKPHLKKKIHQHEQPFRNNIQVNVVSPSEQNQKTNHKHNAEKKNNDNNMDFIVNDTLVVSASLDNKLDMLKLMDVMIAKDIGDENEKKGGEKRCKKHKAIKKWGKKGRKMRDPDPYGFNPNTNLEKGLDGIQLLSSKSRKGICVNAGKYGSSTYTRPNYTGTRPAIKFEVS